MTIKNGDLPAMPIASDNHASDLISGKHFAKQLAGLTKREMFAMAALQGILARYPSGMNFSAMDAVKAADELLAELERTK